MTDISPRISIDDYWHASLNLNFEMYAEDWAGETEPPMEPLNFKPYRGQPRWGLADRVSNRLGDMRSSFPSFRQRHEPEKLTGDLTPERLSQLFYFSFGMSRLDLGPAVVWPYHRFLPSARAFFPTELYAWIPSSGELPAGMYYYDPAHHSLVLLRAGEFLGYVESATGTELEGAAVVLLLSTLFWKNSFLYRNYTYRVAPQEIGILAGNALMVAGTLGLEGHVQHQFLDRALNHLLGLESPDESIMLSLPLYRAEDHRPYRRLPGRLSDERSLIASLPTIKPEYVRTSSLDRRACAKLIDLHTQSLLISLENIAEPAAAPWSEGPRVAAALPVPADAVPPGIELSSALRVRTSGMWIFNAVPRPIPSEHLWRLLRYALEPHVSDLASAGTTPPVECFAVLDGNGVDGIQPGVYRLRPDGSAIEQVVLGPMTPRLQSLQLDLIRPPLINYATANLIVFLAVHRASLTRRFGGRAFRIASHEAGLVAQRICVMGASVGLTVRVHNGYKATDILDLLQLGEDFAPLFQLVIGTARPTARYQMPVAV